MEVFKEFRFEAAHRLVGVPEGHKCARLHGHSYRVRVYVEGPPDPTVGWVIDFAGIKQAFQPIRERLDHALLNEVEGMGNPTAENIARWIWLRLKPALPGLSRLEVRETPTSGCVYRGE
jgi:6-pyruvoyltetrahydropterin/6-carboxytetrahydropterin synthase